VREGLRLRLKLGIELGPLGVQDQTVQKISAIKDYLLRQNTTSSSSGLEVRVQDQTVLQISAIKDYLLRQVKTGQTIFWEHN
jgi:hypothetical protein